MTDTLNSIVETIHIDASPETVWPFLVDPRHVPTWLGCMRYTGEVGSVFYMQMDGAKRERDDVEGATHCEILELSEGKRFVFSWYLPGTPETTVAIRLEDADGGGTTVELEHAGWEQFDAEQIRGIREALEGGWRSFVLPGLKATVEGGA